MSQFITIAGPQSSGKTTAINFLKNKYPDWFYLEEVNPYTVISKNHPGAAYTSKDLQINLIDIELTKLRAIESRYESVSIVELGIFRLIYSEYFYHKKLSEQFLPDYMKLYHDLNPYIILIDTKPEVSFQRRKEKYIERIHNQGIKDKKQFDITLRKYQDTIFHLYPYWLRYYDKLNFPKKLIKNSYISEGEFLIEINKTVKSIISGNFPQ